MFSNDSPQICDCLLRNFPAAGFIIPASSEQSVFRGQLPLPFLSLSPTARRSEPAKPPSSRVGGVDTQCNSFVGAQESKWLENQIYAETVC